MRWRWVGLLLILQKLLRVTETQRILSISVDVTDSEACSLAIQSAREQNGPVDTLVVSAGNRWGFY